MVVSEMGEQWSPITPPEQAAARPMVQSTGSAL
ncbi:unknown [Clostridium sp. CAG:226]|nr:unknown [Clostridium sp. CAG:226]